MVSESFAVAGALKKPPKQKSLSPGIGKRWSKEIRVTFFFASDWVLSLAWNLSNSVM